MGLIASRRARKPERLYGLPSCSYGSRYDVSLGSASRNLGNLPTANGGTGAYLTPADSSWVGATEYFWSAGDAQRFCGWQVTNGSKAGCAREPNNYVYPLSLWDKGAL